MKSKVHVIFSLLLTLGSVNAFAQIGIGTKTPAPSAALEVTSSTNNKGILIPRITATQKDAIVSPAEGLLVYQTTAPIGFYYYSNTVWKLIVDQTDLDKKLASAKTYVDDKIAAATIADADATTKGKIQLAGDLGGTADAPTVPALALKANTSDITTGLALKANTSDVTTALASKANISSLSTVATSGNYNDLANKPNIPSAYVMPKASASVLGGVKVGANLIIDADGVLSATASNTITGVVPIANGGTGATTVAAALTSLGAAPIASPTFTGAVTAPIYASTPQALTDGSTIIWDPALGLNASVTLGGNRTLSFSTTPVAGAYGTLVITQDGTGSRTITLPSTTNKVLGSTSTTTITLSTAANSKDILNFYYDGTNCFWNIGQGYGTAATVASSTTNLVTGVTGTLPVANGGTGATTLTGYVKGAGTATMTASATIPVADITGTLPVANGGTGVATLTGLIKGNGTSAMTAATVGTDYLAPNGSAANLTNFPTLNQNTTGNAANVTGIVAVANGGTGTTNGSITGTTALSFAAGGSNQNVSILPSGTGSVGIGTNSPNSLAILDASSTTKGFLPPRMTYAQKMAIVSPPQGLMIYCTNCGTNGEPEYFNGTSWVNMAGAAAASVPPPPLGSTYQGGKVFYIFQQGDPGYVPGETHGLIAAPSDIPSNSYRIVVGCYGDYGTSTALGTGAANTTKLLACNDAVNAAKLVDALTDGGYSDWYLPSKDELNKLYLNRNLVGNFTDWIGWYWSSSEFYLAPASHAWFQRFTDGSQDGEGKGYQKGIRAIRSF
jgi:hypothetical protein